MLSYTINWVNITIILGVILRLSESVFDTIKISLVPFSTFRSFSGFFFRWRWLKQIRFIQIIVPNDRKNNNKFRTFNAIYSFNIIYISEHHVIYFTKSFSNVNICLFVRIVCACVFLVRFWIFANSNSNDLHLATLQFQRSFDGGWVCYYSIGNLMM